MLNRAIFVSSIIFLFSCSSAQVNREAHPIKFSDIQKIKMGHSQSSDILKAFGKPNEIHTDEQKRDVWIYKDFVYNDFSERASFYINPANGVVTNAIWSPDESTGYSNERELLSSIKLGKFICKLSSPPPDHHYIPSDGSCYNQTVGISYIFLDSSRGIYAISFSEGSDDRTPAQTLKK
jgi:hypothetical protein